MKRESFILLMRVPGRYLHRVFFVRDHEGILIESMRKEGRKIIFLCSSFIPSSSVPYGRMKDVVLYLKDHPEVLDNLVDEKLSLQLQNAE